MFMVPPGSGAISGPLGPARSAAARAVPSPASTMTRSGAVAKAFVEAVADIVLVIGGEDFGVEAERGEDGARRLRRAWARPTRRAVLATTTTRDRVSAGVGIIVALSRGISRPRGLGPWSWPLAGLAQGASRVLGRGWIFGSAVSAAVWRSRGRPPRRRVNEPCQALTASMPAPASAVSDIASMARGEQAAGPLVAGGRAGRLPWSSASSGGSRTGGRVDL